MKLLAIVTPNYNRPTLLNNLYQSLKTQTDKNFTWYIIDDGSQESPDVFVQKFLHENLFEIQYIKKQNGGKHTCINKAMEFVKEELTLIVDNDDMLLSHAVETIAKDYCEIKDNANLCGLGYLKVFSNGKIIGKPYTQNKIIDNFINQRYNKNTFGDKCEVFKTSVLKKYPFPVYKGENFLSESTIWCKMALKYNMLFQNKAIYVAEYQEEGLSAGVAKRLFLNPQGAVSCYLSMSTKPFKLKYKIKYTIAYIVYALASKMKFKQQYQLANSKFLFVLNFLPAWIIYLHKKRKYKGK